MNALTVIDEAFAAVRCTLGPPLESEMAEARATVAELIEALRLSTNGLRTCSRWNISEGTATAITTQIIANEKVLAKAGTP